MRRALGLLGLLGAAFAAGGARAEGFQVQALSGLEFECAPRSPPPAASLPLPPLHPQDACPRTSPSALPPTLVRLFFVQAAPRACAAAAARCLAPRPLALR